MPLTEPRSDQPMTEQAYDRIRERIINLALQPGELLSESTLARSLEMSRTPVREALRRLQGEGLVNLDHRQPGGARVADISVEDVDHAYRVLEVLEALASRTAAELRTPEEAAGLESLAGRLREACDGNNLEAWAATDSELHQTIRAIARNPILSRNLNGLYPRIERIRHVHLWEEPNRDRLRFETERHGSIVAAVVAGDGDQAESLTRALFADARIDNVRLLRTWVAPIRARF